MYLFQCSEILLNICAISACNIYSNVGKTGCCFLFVWSVGPCHHSSKYRRLAHIIKKDRFKMAAVVGFRLVEVSFVRKECMLFAWIK